MQIKTLGVNSTPLVNARTLNTLQSNYAPPPRVPFCSYGYNVGSWLAGDYFATPLSPHWTFLDHASSPIMPWCSALVSRVKVSSPCHLNQIGNPSHMALIVVGADKRRRRNNTNNCGSATGCVPVSNEVVAGIRNRAIKAGTTFDIIYHHYCSYYEQFYYYYLYFHHDYHYHCCCSFCCFGFVFNFLLIFSKPLSSSTASSICYYYIFYHNHYIKYLSYKQPM